MADMPKIAIARLKANAGASKPSNSPLEANVLPGAEHPDANLLAAFVEKALAEKERTQVLNHLSQCADCREVAAFSLPPEIAKPVPTRAPARQRWSPWSILHWGAMAAALGTLTVVVALHPDWWNRSSEVSKVTPAPAPAGKVTSPPQATAAVQPPMPAPQADKAKPRFQAVESAGTPSAMAGESRGAPGTAQDRPAAHATAQKHVTMIAATPAPARLSAENISTAKTTGVESKKANIIQEKILAAPSLPPVAGGEVVGTSVELDKPGPELRARGTMQRTTTQSAAATGGNGGASRVEADVAQPAAPLRAQPSVRVVAAAPMAETRASNTVAATSASLWSISSEAKFQRSADGGKTFERFLVARGIKFRGIAALGGNVWAGGDGGALFHSLDGGATWTRVAINFEGNTLAETILSFKCPARSISRSLLRRARNG